MTRPRKAGYREIGEYYEHLIRTGKLAPGEMLPPEEQLAQRHGVTRTTLRRAFAMLVRKGLVTKTQGRGTFVAPAEVVESRAKRHVVIAAGQTSGSDDDAYMELQRRRYGTYQFLESIITALGDYARPFQVCYFDHTTESIHKIAAAVRRDESVGVITFDVAYPDPIDGLLAIGVPVVFIDSATFGRKMEVVQAANREGMKQATLHLLRSTPGPVAFLGSQADREEGMEGHPQRERLEGFKEAHHELGRDLDESYLFFDWVHAGAGCEPTRQMLQLPVAPTGIACSDDDLAHGVMDELKACHVVIPDQISVIGFGNTIYSRTAVPGLSTVSMDLDGMGRHAVELLEKRLKHPGGEPTVINVPTTLILRQSTFPLLPMGEHEEGTRPERGTFTIR